MNTLIAKTALTVAALISTMAAAHADDWKLGVKISAADGGGVYVHEVFAGSPAELAGLSAGMTILSADGVLYNDPLDFRNVVMTGNTPNIDLIYSDGGKFYQVQAQYQVITTTVMAFDGKKTEQKMLKVKKVNRVEVTDPRVAKKPAAKPLEAKPAEAKPLESKSLPGVKKEVTDPRKK